MIHSKQCNMILYVQKLHPADLKSAVEAYLNCLLTPVRAEFESPEMKKMVAKAYPVEKKSEYCFPAEQ